MKNILNRFKSWATWLALAALVVYLCKTLGGWDIAEWMDGLLNVLLPVLTAFGILNNPTDREHF